MTTINDSIQEFRNLSGIYKGAGGDRIPPHGTTHAKDSTDPIPQEIDGVPVDLDGMQVGEIIVLDADGNLVPGDASGTPTTLQTAYNNGQEVLLSVAALIFQMQDGKGFSIKDSSGGVVLSTSQTGSDTTLAAYADNVFLRDSNLSGYITLSEAGNTQLDTTSNSLVGSINELFGLLTVPEVDYIDFNNDPGVVLDQEGRVYWNGDEYTLNVVTGLGATIQVGHETLILYYNDTGSEIPNGSVVRPNAAVDIGGIIYPTPQLARADNHATCEGTLAFATHDIANGAMGLMTQFGRVRELDTSTYTPGDTGWLSPTVAGGITNVKPMFPNFSISLGGIIKAHATEGEFFVSITRDVYNIFNDAHDGSFMETIKFVVTSDGATVTGSLTNSADSGRDLTMVFSDGFTTLDTTPAATIALTAGTDIAPQRGYVYVLQSTKALTLSTSEWPTAEHIKVADVFIQSATSVQIEGARVNRNWNDHVKSEGDNGHLLHIAERLRREHAQWDSGMEGVTTVVASAVDFSVTSGFAYQLHRQSFPALDTSLGDPVYFVNEFTTPYYKTTDIEDVTDDSSGISLNNTSYSIVYWVVQNRTGEACHLMANMPSGTYSRITPENAVDDAENKSVYAFPEAFQGKGVLVARCTYVNTSGTITLYDTEDLRGKIPNATAGGGAGGTGVTTFLGLSDTDSSYTGNAGKVPNVNVGETALEFIELSTDKTLNGNGTDTPFSLDPSIPLDTGDSYEFTQNSITGSTDTFAVSNRDITLQHSQAPFAQSVAGGSVAVDADFSYICYSGPDALYRYDRRTGIYIEDVTPPANRAIVVVNGYLIFITSSTSLRQYDKNDLTTYTNLTVTGDTFSTAVFDAFYNPVDGLIYATTSAGEYGIIELTVGGAVLTLIADNAASITNAAVSISLSAAGDTYYIVDAGSSTSAYVREFNLATGALVRSSSALTTTTDSHLGDTVFVRDSNTVGVSLRGKVFYFDTVLATTFTGVAEVGELLSLYYEGYLYGALQSSTNVIPSEYQPPGLTVVPKAYVEAIGGEGVKSSDSVVDISGVAIPVSKADEVKNVLDIVPLKSNRFSAQVTSVETSLPATPLWGKYYLMDTTSTDYPGTVAMYDARGWNIYRPYHGATLRDAGGQYTYEYYTDRWIKKVDMRLVASLVDASSSNPTDIMTIDVGDGTYPDMDSLESWDVEILISAYPVSGGTSEPVVGKWEFNGVVCNQGSNSIINNATINPVNAADLITSHANYDTPTVGVNTTTGALEVTVGVTDSYVLRTYEFVATVRGNARTMTTYTPA